MPDEYDRRYNPGTMNLFSDEFLNDPEPLSNNEANLLPMPVPKTERLVSPRIWKAPEDLDNAG